MNDAPPSWGGIGEPAPSFEWKQLSTIPVKPIVWVDYPFLQGSAFHLLAGIKNSGKGTWLANVAARCTRGEFNAEGWPESVLWLALGEDSYSIDVRPRIEAAGGDSAGVFVLDGWGFRLPDHGQQLEDKVRDARARMVIIDPLGGATSGESDRDWHVRPALQALNYLADQTGTMVFGVRHISNKAGKRGEGVLSGILGSSDWVNIPRAVLALLHDDVDPDMRHLFAITGNRGPSDTPGLMVRIEGAPVEGQDHEVALARIIGESHKDPDELLTVKRSRRTSRSDSARVLVLEILRNEIGAQMESDALDTEVARRTGLAAKTVRNVRNELRNQGLLKAIPVGGTLEEGGGVKVWLNALTNSGIAAADRLRTDTDASPPASPVTPQSQRSLLEQHTSAVGIFSPQAALPGMSPGSSVVEPRSLDPEDPDLSNGTGSLGVNGAPLSVQPQMSVRELPDWERAWHERRGG
jgi:AAA domain